MHSWNHIYFPFGLTHVGRLRYTGVVDLPTFVWPGRALQAYHKLLVR